MSTANVLLVDHDHDAVTRLASLLSEAGCNVSSTLDPRLALALARKCKPDIAFIELRTRHITGLNLAKAFRAEQTLSDCALVAFSGGGPEDTWPSVAAGFHALLSKPAQRDEVLATVEMLASPRSQRG